MSVSTSRKTSPALSNGGGGSHETNNMENITMTNEELRRGLKIANTVCTNKAFVADYPAVYYTGFVAKHLLDTMFISDEVDTAGVSVSGLVVNPEFMAQCTPPQWNFILLHEALHIRLDHIKRMEGKYHVIANVAGDLAINCMIEQWTKIQTKKSEVWPYDHLIERVPNGCYPGQNDFAKYPPFEAMEWYYNELMKDIQNRAKQMQQGQQGQGQPQQGQQGQGQQQQGQGQGQQQGGQGSGKQKVDPNQSGGGLMDALADAWNHKDDPQQGGGDGEGPTTDPNPGLTEEEIKDLLNKMGATGTIETDIDDPAKQAAMGELVDKMMQKATDDALGRAEELEKKAQSQHISGGMTKQKLEDYLNGPKNADEQKARQFNRQNQAQQMSSGSAQRGVDGIVDRADDEAMWMDILEPIRTKVLTDKRQFNHRRATQMAIADALSDDFGVDVHLKGRVWGYSAGGEVLVIVDTSGSTCDYWQISIAKCVECISVMAQNKVILRVVVFSDSDPSINDEFVFYNGEQVEEEDFSHQSVVEDGKDLLPDHIVDVQDMIMQDTVETAKLVGNTITGGGGTAILPVVNKIRNVVGEDVSQRFLVTVIITDAELYGPDVPWSRSSDVTDTFGEHVAWLFLDLYGADYASIVGEKKFLISCGR